MGAAGKNMQLAIKLFPERGKENNYNFPLIELAKLKAHFLSIVTRKIAVDMMRHQLVLQWISDQIEAKFDLGGILRCSESLS